MPRLSRPRTFVLVAAAIAVSLIAVGAYAVSVNDAGARRQLRQANNTLDDQLEQIEQTNGFLDTILGTLGEQASINHADQDLNQRLSQVPARRRGAGWGRMTRTDDPATEPEHPAILRFRAFSRDATFLRLPITSIPEPLPQDFQGYQSTREWALSAFYLLPDENHDVVTAGKSMTAWRTAFARQSALDAWTTASAAQRAPDDAGVVHHAMLDHMAQTSSLREDLRLLIHATLETNLAISATNRILAAQLEAQATAYLSSGPSFVSGPSLAPVPVRLGSSIIRSTPRQ